MSKNTNLSFLTDFITADIVNSRVGINNASPQTTFDVTGTGKFSGILTLGSTISNGTYAYTLPSATGTLALTSDIPSVTGYVPYTGATQAVNLGYNSLSASFLRIDGAGPTLGSYLGFKHSTNVTTGADGYTSIYTFGTNTIAFKSVSGATTRDFSFSMASITPGVPGGRTYTLPDADGTIALTSNIPANPVGGTGTTNYLPKFTAGSTIGNSQVIDNGSQVGIGLNPNTSYGTLQIKSPASAYSLDLVGRTAGVNSENQITFWNSTQTTGLAYIYNSLSNLYLGTGANQPFTLSSGGNFIFGSTTDAGFKLDVNGNGRFNKELYLNSASGLTGQQGYLFFNYSPSNAGSRSWKISNDQNAWGDFVIQSSATQTGAIVNTPLSISSSGVMTLSGTTGNRLVLYNSGNNGGLNGLLIDSDIYPGISFYNRLTTSGAIIGGGKIVYNSIATGYGAASLGGAILLQADNAMQFSTGGDNVRMTIRKTGQIGLGTTTPERQFVVSNGGADGIEFTQIGSEITEVITYNRSTSAYTPLQFESSRFTFNRGNFLIGTTSDNGTKLRVNGTANIPTLTHEPSYHGTKVLIYGPTSSTTINLPTEFPLMGLTTGNSWAVFGKYCGLTGSGGGSEAREFYISRNTSGTWSSPAYSLDANTGASLSSVSGSGANLVIATTSNAYFGLELTVMIR